MQPGKAALLWTHAERTPAIFSKLTDFDRVPSRLDRIPCRFEGILFDLERIPSPFESNLSRLECDLCRLERFPCRLDDTPCRLECHPRPLGFNLSRLDRDPSPFEWPLSGIESLPSRLFSPLPRRVMRPFQAVCSRRVMQAFQPARGVRSAPRPSSHPRSLGRIDLQGIPECSLERPQHPPECRLESPYHSFFQIR